jgi:microcystin-dependent protein
MDSYLGELRMVGFNFAPEGWALCQGQLMPIQDYETLFELIGTTYGGDGRSTFGLPDLQGRVPIGSGTGNGLSPRGLGQTGGEETVVLTTGQLPQHQHALLASGNPSGTGAPANQVLGSQVPFDLYTDEAPSSALDATSIRPSGGSQPHQNRQQYLVVNFLISLDGVLPSGSPTGSPEPFLGEIRVVPWSIVPSGWAPCAGQLMPLSQNTVLFSLLGTVFGGNGRTTFALPDLRGSVALGSGQGAGLSDFFVGDAGGSDAVALVAPEMPSHSHSLVASPNPGQLTSPAALAAPQNGQPYQTGISQQVPLSSAALAVQGGGQPHNNMQPSLALQYLIAIAGVLPQRG